MANSQCQSGYLRSVILTKLCLQGGTASQSLHCRTSVQRLKPLSYYKHKRGSWSLTPCSKTPLWEGGVLKQVCEESKEKPASTCPSAQGLPGLAPSTGSCSQLPLPDNIPQTGQLAEIPCTASLGPNIATAAQLFCYIASLSQAHKATLDLYQPNLNSRLAWKYPLPLSNTEWCRWTRSLLLIVNSVCCCVVF